MAVAGVGVERDVGDEAKLRELALNRAAGPADEIAFVEGFAAPRVLERRFGVREQTDRRNAELYRPPGLAHQFINAEPIDARHRGDWNATLVAFDQEQRPDEVARSQDMLGDQPARPVSLAISARAAAEIEAMGWRDTGRFVHGNLEASINIIIPDVVGYRMSAGSSKKGGAGFRPKRAKTSKVLAIDRIAEILQVGSPSGALTETSSSRSGQ